MEACRDPYITHRNLTDAQAQSLLGQAMVAGWKTAVTFEPETSDGIHATQSTMQRKRRWGGWSEYRELSIHASDADTVIRIMDLTVDIPVKKRWWRVDRWTRLDWSVNLFLAALVAIGIWAGIMWG